jgi:hypothetical protein
MTPEERKTAAREEAVQVPGIIISFLNRATVAVAATRDEKLAPRVHRVSGWRVEPDQESMACFIPEAFTAGLRESLEGNGEFALTIEEIGPHETYQFKGKLLDIAPCSTADLQIFQKVRERFGSVVSAFYGVPEEICRAFVMRPTASVRFRVQAIYVQTPGPAAGQRLVPVGKT